MKRLERLTALLSQLQSKRHCTLELLVKKFGVSERTLYRDLRSLEEAGVPIGFERDLGYFILDRHFLPPLAFTPEEARSFIFVEELARKYTDEETFGYFSSALEKIKAKLRDHQLDDVENLQANVKAYIDKRYTPRHLSLAETACRQKQVLKIHYTAHGDRTSEREIEPIGLTFYSQQWHVIAWCRLRQAFRDFVLTRIQNISATGEVFKARQSLDDYIRDLQKEENR